MTAPLTACAPAKLNLTLRIAARRADGFHDLESLVVFARFGDTLTLEPGRPFGLSVKGPNADLCGAPADNLVLKAAHALAGRLPQAQAGHFVLDKRIPVAAGLGGGSADAAAALRLFAQLNGLPASDTRVLDAARQTGADVPVCLDPRPRVMRGIGDLLSEPLDLPELSAVLVNPGVGVRTAEIFARFDERAGEHRSNSVSLGPIPRQIPALLSLLHAQANDLEPVVVALHPVVGDVLASLRTPNCRLARMSGSGATCFGLFDTAHAATAAARTLRAAHPGWWIEETALGV